VLLARGEGVILPPLAEADQEVEQVLTLLGQDVLLIGTSTGRGLDAQDSGIDQVPQARGEDVLGDAQIALELAEAPDAVEGVADDQQRPLVADDVDGADPGGVGSRP